MSDSNEWKTYDDFIYGAATNRLPASDALSGQTLTVISQHAPKLELRFVAADRVHWRSGAASGEDWCEVIEVAADTYFVDMTFGAWPREALTVIANTATRRSLSIRSIVREQEVENEPRVMQRFDPGVLEGMAAEGLTPGPTRDLVGLRTLNVYSPNHTYEHIYLSSERYAWQCLVGVQRGHGDVDLATTYRFAEDQYVFTFREFKIAVASVFFLNFKDLRSTGEFLGITADGRVSNEPAGAFITKNSMTFYPPGAQPV
ncbi:MAG: MoaF C-terminal domain-containing protein [Caulobacteraceae bacterium]